jgi:signal transduction histidine kinase
MKTTDNGSIRLFASLLDSEIVRLLASMKRVSVPQGTLVIREGDPGGRFYLIIDGELEVIKALGTQDERFLGDLEPGDSFGEMSLFDPDGLRVASVRAKTAANLYEMLYPEFYALMHRRSTVAYEIARILSQRLSTSHINTIRDLQEKNSRLAQACHELQQAQSQINEKEQNLRYLMAQVLTAHEEERKRIAFELHDDVGTSLTALKMQLRHLERKLGDMPQQQGECDESLIFIDEIIGKVRRLSREMRPPTLDDLGLTVTLDHLFNEFGKYEGLKVSVEKDDIEGLFPIETQIGIYRVFQEALNNIVKHSGATRVEVAIKKHGHCVEFSIEDNGAGFFKEELGNRKAHDQGMGLATIDERVRLLGGALKLQSKPGQGTRLHFTIPGANQKL